MMNSYYILNKIFICIFEIWKSWILACNTNVCCI